MMGISIWQLLIVLLIVVLLFGTKKLRSIGKDMGGAVKGFRDAMSDNAKAGKQEQEQEQEQEPQSPETLEHQESKRVIEGEVTRKENEKV